MKRFISSIPVRFKTIPIIATITNQNVNVLEVVAENVQLLESKAQSQSRQAYPTNQGSGYSYEPDNSSMNDTKQYSSQYDLSDDDLPF